MNKHKDVTAYGSDREFPALPFCLATLENRNYTNPGAEAKKNQ